MSEPRAKGLESRQGEPGVVVKKAVCPHDCWDTCSMLVHVKDGRVQRVMGNPDQPLTKGYLCVKVNHYEERVYSPDRILYPMRRTGPKGSRQFERITWAEALDEIYNRFTQIIAEHGAEAILPYSYAGTIGLLQYGSLDRRFFHTLGASRLARTICATAGGEAILTVNGIKQGPDPEEMVNCKLIVAWGVNVVSSNPHQWPIIQEARRRGAKLVVIDPYRYKGAREADWHISPRPGTDTAFVMGVMHELIAQDWLDHAYIAEYTKGFDQLKEKVSDWTPEKAAAVTGIPAADIRAFAKLWWESRPAIVRVGYGLQRHTNGGMTVRSIAMLPALTGHWRDRGGGFLLSQSGSYDIPWSLLERPDLMPEPRPREINMIQIGQALTALNDPPVKALVVYNSNPASVAPNSSLVKQGFLREDLFTVVHEQLFTDTCEYADIILPATTQLEHTDLMYSYWHLYLQLNEPAIEPLGEAVSNTELYRRLSQRFGFTDPACTESDESIIRTILANSKYMQGITLERLRQEYIIKVNRAPAPFAEGGFGTPSGKVEFYSEELARAGQEPVIDYMPLAESVDGSPELAAKYPLNLISPAAHHFLNTTFANQPRMMKGQVVPLVYISEADATARGVVNGDWVRVFNGRGSVRLQAVVGDTTKPGTLVAPTIWWTRFSPDGQGINNLTSDRTADYGGGATFHTNLVQVEKAEAPDVVTWEPPAVQRELIDPRTGELTAPLPLRAND
ncbi:MAG TPA: molybdopterin oxidoreductase family protein [Symbiobacteriaceae bacterium]|nr:molybdopterin oxidoreductase family protein [Symbiobacteriaceae bacterium]